MGRFIGHRFSVLKPTLMATRSSWNELAKVRQGDRLARSIDGRGLDRLGVYAWGLVQGVLHE